MKLAIAVVGDQVNCHFGSCESFTLCEIQGTELTDQKVIGTDGNTHGDLPGYLAGLKVNAVISATMGGGAMRKLADLGIACYPDVTGQVDEVIQRYLAGELAPTQYDPNLHACNHNNGENHHGEGHACSCGGK